MQNRDLREDFFRRAAFPNSPAFADYSGNTYAFSHSLAYFLYCTRDISISSAPIGLISSDTIESYILAFFLSVSPFSTYFLPSDWLTSSSYDKSIVQLDFLLLFKSDYDCPPDQSLIKAIPIQCPSIQSFDPSSFTHSHSADLYDRLFRSGEPSVCYLSSGSTGCPKLIPLSYSNVNSCYQSVTSSVYAKISFIEIISLHNTSFVISLPFLFAFSFGVESVLYARSSRLKISALLQFAVFSDKLKLPLLITVPSIIRTLFSISSFQQALSGFSLISCGEPLSMDLALKTRSSGIQAFFNLYGSTEVAPWIISLNILNFLNEDPANQHLPILPVGLPLPNVDVVISASKSELLVSSVSVFSGYLQGPPDSDVFSSIAGKTYFRTGDSFHYYKDYLCCDGRINSAVKLAGIFVNPVILESSLRMVLDGLDYLIIPNVQTSSLLLLIFDRGLSVSDTIKSNILSALRQRIHKSIAVRISFTSDLPKYLRSGKLDRKFYSRQPG